MSKKTIKLRKQKITEKIKQRKTNRIDRLENLKKTLV
jgi:hypothetical protein